MSAMIFIAGFFVFCMVFLFPAPATPIEKEIIVLMRKRRLIAFENGRELFQIDCTEGNPLQPTKPGIFRFLNNATSEGEGAHVQNTQIPCKLFFSKDGKAIDLAISCEPVGEAGNSSQDKPDPNGQRLFGCVHISQDAANKLFPWTDAGTQVRIVFW